MPNYSRSQCIINIRHALKSSHRDYDKLKTVIFTIVDLAGAERERRTGVQVYVFIYLRTLYLVIILYNLSDYILTSKLLHISKTSQLPIFFLE